MSEWLHSHLPDSPLAPLPSLHHSVKQAIVGLIYSHVINYERKRLKEKIALASGNYPHESGAGSFH